MTLTQDKPDVGKNYVVVERDHRGWSIVGRKLYRQRLLAAMAASGVENGMVLPARRRRLRLPAIGDRPEQKTVINVDWSACPVTGPETSENWYAVRVAAGTQRMAKALPIAANATEKERQEAERRKGETIIERQARQEGIDVYMPAFWEEIRAHRGHKMRARRLPLFPGYVFIRRDPRLGFKPVKEEVEGVIDFVSVKQRPVIFSEDDIRFLMIQMFEREQAFRFKRALDAETKQFKRRQTLNAELGRHLPRGRGRTVSLRVYAEACINSLPSTSRERVLGIMSALDGLDEEYGLADFREPV